jgi:hypothetical protein
MTLPRESSRAQSALSPSSGQPIQRFTRESRCPVCGGCDEDPRGNGKRCVGFVSGDWIHCTREEFGTGCKAHPNASPPTWSHRLKGPCPCGTEHNPADHLNGQATNGKSKFGPVDRVYKYHDQAGKVVFETVRFRDPKDFRQRRKVNGKDVWNLQGVALVLYHLPVLLAADTDQPVFIVEGEKDVEALSALGRLATTNPMGAGKWRDHYTGHLQGRHVIIIPDNDKAGRDHAQKVAQSLHGRAASVKIVELPGLPERGDVSDFLASGGTVDQLDELAHKAPEWTPPRAAPRKKPARSDGEPVWIETDRGAWSPCVSNIVRWLEWKGIDRDYVRDDFLDIVTVKGQEIVDTDPTRLTIAIEEDRQVPATSTRSREAIHIVAARNAVDSLKDYFASIVWDGTPRVDTYFERAYHAVAATLEDQPVASDPAERDKAVRYCRFVSKSFLIGLAARALEPGCQVDTMPVLIGDQGLNKSASFRELCPRPEWFTDDIGDIHTKDACANLKGILIVEFAEFNRLMRASAAAAKSFLTKRDDRYREAYGHYTVRHLRRCVFVGSTNDEMPLIDTENRRFYPLRVGLADLDYIRKNRDQLLAEAAQRFRAGESWWTRDEEILDVVRERQDIAQKPDAWAEVLAAKLNSLGATFTQTDAFEALVIPIERRTGKAISDMGNALKKAGCKSLPRRKIAGVRTTFYANPSKPAGTAF